MILNIIKELGYDYDQFAEQAHNNSVDYVIYGHMWDAKDDIVLNILYNAFVDVNGVLDVDGMCDIIDMLEEEFKFEDDSFNVYLYYAIVFRDRYGSR